MLPESKNIQTIADNIRTLENQINALDVEIPPHVAADAGKILAVDSEGDLEWKTEYSYTPPAYSTDEVNTGQKWIDGRDIYSIIFTGDLPTISGSSNIVFEIDIDIDILVDINAVVRSAGYTAQTNRYNASYQPASGITIYSVAVGYSLGTYSVSLFYTKPVPVPVTETKSKKGGTKK